MEKTVVTDKEVRRAAELYRKLPPERKAVMSFLLEVLTDETVTQEAKDAAFDAVIGGAGQADAAEAAEAAQTKAGGKPIQFRFFIPRS